MDGRNIIRSMKMVPKTQMHLQMMSYDNHVQNIIEAAHREGFSWDVVIKCGPQKLELKCHKMILCFSSDFLREALRSSRDGAIPVILLPDIAPVTMEFILAYIYTGEYCFGIYFRE